MSERYPYGYGEAGPVAPPLIDVDEDLWLESWKAGDGPLYYQKVHQNRDYVRPASQDLADITLEQAMQSMDMLVANIATGRTAGYKVMREIGDNNEMIGGINLFRREGIAAGMGYWRVEHAGGEGYMTRAAQRLLRFAFDQSPIGWDLQRVWLGINPTNQASIRLATNIGAHVVMNPYVDLRAGEVMYEVVKGV